MCLQWCELLPDGSTTTPEVLPAWEGADARAREVFADAVMSPSWVLLGQNVAGDMLKAALAWGLLRETDNAYRQGRVRCTMLAQRLIDVAWPGRLVWVPLRRKPAPGAETSDNLDEVDDSQFDERAGKQGFYAIRKFRPDRLLGREVEFTEEDEGGGRGLRAKAGLDALAARYLGLDLSADKKSADSWRKRYGELIGVPVAEWPEEAYRYAADDPVITAKVRAAQAGRPTGKYGGSWVDVLYPPAPALPWAPLRCERFEVHAHFAFADMERSGLERDQPRIESMRAKLQAAALAGERSAVRAGVVRLDCSRDMAEVRRRAEAGEPVAKSGLEDLRLAQVIADRRDVAALEEFTAARPWIRVARVKDSSEVLSRATALYKAAGWHELPRTATHAVSAAAEHLQQVVRPAPDADPQAAEDLRQLVGLEVLAHLQEWSEAGEYDRIEKALEAANDPGLAAHLARQKCHTFDASFLAAIDARHRATNPDRWRDPEGPAKFGFSPFKSTARAGIRGDVRMNMPKAGGVRECFVPRKGRVFLCVDYAACEMSTFADVLDELVCLGLYGRESWSTLGQAIRAGDDCHLRLAATMRREPYEQLRARYKPVKDKIDENGKGSISKGELLEWLELDLDRAGAKEGNFGFMGGMGPGKFSRLQRKKGRDMSEQRARHIRESWMEVWSPEVPDYLGLAGEATGSRGQRRSATVVHGRGGHVRGGLDFCQWANTHFQQRAAAGAKRAAILLFRACRLDPSSPLSGVADPVLFVHDEFILECDAEAARLIADPLHPDDEKKRFSPPLREMERLMVAGMAQVCRTPVKAEGKILHERWTK